MWLMVYQCTNGTSYTIADREQMGGDGQGADGGADGRADGQDDGGVDGARRLLAHPAYTVLLHHTLT